MTTPTDPTPESPIVITEPHWTLPTAAQIQDAIQGDEIPVRVFTELQEHRDRLKTISLSGTHTSRSGEKIRHGVFQTLRIDPSSTLTAHDLAALVYLRCDELQKSLAGRTVNFEISFYKDRAPGSHRDSSRGRFRFTIKEDATAPSVDNNAPRDKEAI